MRDIRYRCLFSLAVGFLLAANAPASVISIAQSAFPTGATTIDFTGIPDGTEVNGLTVSGANFSYLLNGVPTSGAVQIDGGPGSTNHLSPPNVVSVGDPTGVLDITLPSAVKLFGYGFAILSGDPVTGATSVTAFNGATALGSLSFDGVPDPTFTGGFAGIQSTLAFDRVELTFSSDAPAFAIDNLMLADPTAAAPEPSTLLIAVLGFGTIATRRLRRRR